MAVTFFPRRKRRIVDQKSVKLYSDTVIPVYLNYMNKKRYIILLFCAAAASLIAMLPGSASAGGYSPVAFREVWAYMMRGEEKKFRGDEPVTDICYFSCGVTYKGTLTSRVSRPSLPAGGGFNRRIHLVISNLDNAALTHFSLDPKYGIRDALVEEIVLQSDGFDGIQIDFEAVEPGDAAAFADFLALIRSKLDHEKMLSVALPARRKKVADAYDYVLIASIVDRVIVMAYDEHWSASKPGPVASLDWCRDVAAYSRSAVPAGRLIIGLPLYGRAWQKNGYSRAVRWYDVENILSRDDAQFEYSVDTGWIIRCDEKVAVVVYFDDVTATREKLLLYRNYTDSVAFWRLGMEKAELWGIISIEKGNDLAGKSGVTDNTRSE